MEAAGLGIGIASLASLVTTAKDLNELCDAYKEYPSLSKIRDAQREANIARYTSWRRAVFVAGSYGHRQDVGLQKDGGCGDNSVEGRCAHPALQDPAIRTAVSNIVQSLQVLGIAESSPPLADESMLHHTSADAKSPLPIPEHTTRQGQLGNTRVRVEDGRGQKEETQKHSTLSRRSKLAWAFKDKKRAEERTALANDLIGALYELVPPENGGRLELGGGERYGGEVEGVKIYSRLEKIMEGIANILAAEQRARQDDIRKEIRSWLGGSQLNKLTYQNHVQRRLPGTCNWLLEQPEFLNFVAQKPTPKSDHYDEKMRLKPAVLWIYGPAGFGKSVICARVVEYLLEKVDGQHVAYHFFSAESPDKSDPNSIIRSWISQLGDRHTDAFELVVSEWQETDQQFMDSARAWSVFGKLLEILPPYVFVIDGLDECAGTGIDWKTSYRDSLHGFFASLRKTLVGTTSRLIVVSRNEPEIRQGLYNVEQIDPDWNVGEYRIESHNIKGDATIYTRDIIDRRMGRKTEEFRHELSERIVDKMDSTFICIKMLENQLRSGQGQKQLRMVIDQAPTGLNELYDKNWQRVTRLPEVDRVRALAVLRWATFAIRPMSVAEMTGALLVDVDEDEDEDERDIDVEDLPDDLESYVETEILELCASLVELRGGQEELTTKTVHLAHFTVKEYIICQTVTLGRELHDSVFHNNVLARACLLFLSHAEIWSVEKPNSAVANNEHIRAFRQYASEAWFQHFANEGSMGPVVLSLINNWFSKRGEPWESWRRCRGTSLIYTWTIESDEEDPIGPTSPLTYAALLGLEDTILYLIRDGRHDVNEQDAYAGMTPLLAAAYKGHVSCVTRLLQNGADPNFTNNSGTSPLHAAVHSGSDAITALLIHHGADWEAREMTGDTPLLWACRLNEIGPTRELVKAKADVTVRTNTGLIPICLAVYHQNCEMLRVLVETGGADVNARTEDNTTSVFMAAANGYVEILRMLVEEFGADVNATTKNQTPLYAASYFGEKECVELLLRNGAVHPMLDFNHTSPIEAAASRGHTDVVRALLDAGIDQLPRPGHASPLCLAASGGRTSTLQLLLGRGADVCQPLDIYHGQSILFESFFWVDASTYLLLLDACPSTRLDDRDRYGSTLHSVAIRCNDMEIEQYLRDRGANVDISDHFGRDTEHWLKRLKEIPPGRFCLKKCDVCFLKLHYHEPHYRCEVCNKGDVDICAECFSYGARCFDEAHELVLTILPDEGAEDLK